MQGVRTSQYRLPGTTARYIKKYLNDWQEEEGPHDTTKEIIRDILATKEAKLKESMRKAMAAVWSLPNCRIPGEQAVEVMKMMSPRAPAAGTEMPEHLTKIFEAAQEKDEQS